MGIFPHSGLRIYCSLLFITFIPPILERYPIIGVATMLFIGEDARSMIKRLTASMK